jgi:short-subunit dehydrogenase
MTQINPRALITGASSGIGKVYAEQLARRGYDLVLVARRLELLEQLGTQLHAEHGIEVEVLAADLSAPQDLAKVCARIENGSPIDLLVNNAGYAARGKVAELDPAALATMLSVNVVAMGKLAHSTLAQMLKSGHGAIINIGSATAFILIPGNAGYAASKSYVTSFTRHMQLEAAGTDVQVQLLIPGIVATDFHRTAGADLTNYPADRVMSARDLVRASLQALEMREPVCIPSLPDTKDWQGYLAVEQALAANVSHDRIAARYT